MEDLNYLRFINCLNKNIGTKVVKSYAPTLHGNTSIDFAPLFVFYVSKQQLTLSFKQASSKKLEARSQQFASYYVK